MHGRMWPNHSHQIWDNVAECVTENWHEIKFKTHVILANQKTSKGSYDLEEIPRKFETESYTSYTRTNGIFTLQASWSHFNCDIYFSRSAADIVLQTTFEVSGTCDSVLSSWLI